MTDEYQLLGATIATTGAISPKRLEKVVCILQARGAPLRYRYETHFEEPFSDGIQSDLKLLEAIGAIRREDTPESGLQVVPQPLAYKWAKAASELERYRSIIDDLRGADPRLVDLAATHSIWLGLRYAPQEAFRRAADAFAKTDAEARREGERLVERLGLLGVRSA